MNKLYDLLGTEPTHTKDQFEKSFKKVFGIPADFEDYDGSIIFSCYGEKFSVDYEGNLLWYLNNDWHTVQDLTHARMLWATKK